MSKKKKTTEDIEVLEGEVLEEGLLPFNPLMGSVAISPDDEDEQKYELVKKTESLAELNEQHLKVEQQKAKFEIELKKIGTSKKLTDSINTLIDLGLSVEVLTDVVTKIKTPLDLKLYSEAIKNLTDSRNKNMDSINRDENGQRNKIKVMANFQGVSVGLEMPMPNNND